MIEEHSFTLINMETSGLASMIAYEQFTNIKLMYDLFSRTKTGLWFFEEFLAAQVKTSGLELV